MEKREKERERNKPSRSPHRASRESNVIIGGAEMTNRREKAISSQGRVIERHASRALPAISYSSCHYLRCRRDRRLYGTLVLTRSIDRTQSVRRMQQEFTAGSEKVNRSEFRVSSAFCARARAPHYAPTSFLSGFARRKQSRREKAYLVSDS